MNTCTAPAPMALEASLQACLDAEAMCGWLQQCLPEALQAGQVVEQVQMESVQRSSSRQRAPHPVTLVYVVTLRDPAGGRRQSRRWYAKMYRHGLSALPAPGPTSLHLPALDMRLWPWPADPAMPQLAALLAPERTQPFWGQAAASVQALHYRPEQRATLRYLRQAAPCPDGGEALYAKTYADGRAEPVFQRFAHFWAQAKADAQAPLVAEPLAVDLVHRAVWQAAAPGTPLLDVLARPDGPWAAARCGQSAVARCGQSAALAAGIAGALAAVHAAPAALAGTRQDLGHWRAELPARQKKIARAVPGLSGRAAALVDSLMRQADTLGRPPEVLIHGDAHPGQLWLHRGRVVLFDFDEFALGDPMQDLAAFVGKLATAPGGQALVPRLLAAYAEQAPQHFGARRLRWHQALQAVLQACRAFVFQLPGWRQELQRRLAQAEAAALRIDEEGS